MAPSCLRGTRRQHSISKMESSVDTGISQKEYDYRQKAIKQKYDQAAKVLGLTVAPARQKPDARPQATTPPNKHEHCAL